jgi:hypothetical protein
VEELKNYAVKEQRIQEGDGQVAQASASLPDPVALETEDRSVTEAQNGQFAVKHKSDTYCWTQKLNKEDYGVDKYWVLLAVVKEKKQG